jgi:hypothetical protein
MARGRRRGVSRRMMGASSPRVHASRLRRSLFVPASAESMVRKVGPRGADVVILDPRTASTHARSRRVRRGGVLREVDFGSSEVFVRIAPSRPLVGRGPRPCPRAAPSWSKVLPGGRATRRVAAGMPTPLFAMVEAPRRSSPPGHRHSSSRARGADARPTTRRAWRGPDPTAGCSSPAARSSAARAAPRAYDAPFFDYRDLRGLGSAACHTLLHGRPPSTLPGGRDQRVSRRRRRGQWARRVVRR